MRGFRGPDQSQRAIGPGCVGEVLPAGSSESRRARTVSYTPEDEGRAYHEAMREPPDSSPTRDYYPVPLSWRGRVVLVIVALIGLGAVCVVLSEISNQLARQGP